MIFDNLQQLMLTQYKVLRGSIIKFTEHGEIIVIPDATNQKITCLVLSTTPKEGMTFSIGDKVLIAFDDETEEGYILGTIAAFHPGSEAAENTTFTKQETEDEIRITAGKRVEIRCGKSSFIMTEEGNIYIKGAKIVSRASQVQKIKGASVQIN